MIRLWNALVCRAWYAAGCPDRFPLKRIVRAPRPGVWLAVVAGAATVGAVVGGVLGTVPDVSPVPVESVDSGDVWVSRAAPVGARDLQVTLSNGDVFELPPCASDDGRDCYWDAATFGDGAGESYVDAAGLVLYVDIDGMGAQR